MGGNELLVILGDHGNWKRFRTLVKDYTLRKEHKLLVDALELYYKNNPTVAKVDWAGFETWFMAHKGATFSPSEVKAYQMMFDRIRKDDADGTVALNDVLDHYIKLDYTAQVQGAVAKILRDPSEDLGVIATLVDKYEREVSRALSKSDVFVSPDLRAVVDSVSTPGFNWRLGFLNRAVGQLRQGDFVILGARPETGKTTFLASELSHMATQPIHAERPIIWVNNEERSEKVYFRTVQAAFQATSDEIMDDLPGFSANFKAIIPEHRLLITIKDGSTNSVHALEALFEEHNPCMIVFDQLDKVYGFPGEAREDIRLGKVYAWARDMAAKYGPVIAVSQLSEGAEEMMYPSDAFLRGSKTDKSGEADVIITIGRNRALGENIRGIYLPKNKQLGGAGTEEAFRHGKCELEIVPERAFFKEPK